MQGRSLHTKTIHRSPCKHRGFSLIKNPGGRSWITEKIGLPSGTRAMEKYLVGGWALPLWKMMEFVSDYEIPKIWKNKKCSKPPTRYSSPFYRDFGHKCHVIRWMVIYKDLQCKWLWRHVLHDPWWIIRRYDVRPHLLCHWLSVYTSHFQIHPDHSYIYLNSTSLCVTCPPPQKKILLTYH